jgi:hypothetical protein
MARAGAKPRVDDTARKATKTAVKNAEKFGPAGLIWFRPDARCRATGRQTSPGRSAEPKIPFRSSEDPALPSRMALPFSIHAVLHRQRSHASCQASSSTSTISKTLPAHSHRLLLARCRPLEIACPFLFRSVSENVTLPRFHLIKTDLYPLAKNSAKFWLP